MNDETRRLDPNATDDDLNNFELIQRKIKLAKIYLIFSGIGIFTGISVGFCFLFAYDNTQTGIFGFFSAICAGFVFYIHFQHLKNVWQIWQYQLKYWMFLGLVLQVVFVCAFVTFLILGIRNKQSLNGSSYYVTSVWAAMSWKWSFALYFFSQKYRKMYNRYSPIAEGN